MPPIYKLFADDTLPAKLHVGSIFLSLGVSVAVGVLFGWYPAQRLTVDEVIYGYTLGAAYAGYSDHELGSIEVGKLADLTVFSRDLTAIPPDEILGVKVERVMVDGEWM